MTREVKYIDVGNMSMQEAHEAIGKKYVPWYKDPLFYAICVVCIPWAAMMFLVSEGAFR